MFYDDYSDEANALATVCGNAGWSTEEILFTVTSSMNFLDCYKIVINTFLDWS